jgi:hypothetical protein
MDPVIPPVTESDPVISKESPQIVVEDPVTARFARESVLVESSNTNPLFPWNDPLRLNWT